MLKFTSSLQPINKAYFVSFLAAGSGCTKRIARWVAHSIIVGTDALTVVSRVTKKKSHLPDQPDLRKHIPTYHHFWACSGRFTLLQNPNPRTRRGYSNCMKMLIMSIWDSMSRSSPWRFRMLTVMLLKNTNVLSREQLYPDHQEAQVNRLLTKLRHLSSLFGRLLKTYILKLVRLILFAVPRLLSDSVRSRHPSSTSWSLPHKSGIKTTVNEDVLPASISFEVRVWQSQEH
jgi:hypothetical protein